VAGVTRRDDSDAVDLLIVTKGHRYERDAFMAMFEADAGIHTTVVEQPAAQVVLRPASAVDYDVVLFYDLSGIALPGNRLAGKPGDLVAPTLDYQRSLEALLQRGTGIVLMSPGLVSWPDWPLWRALSRTSLLLRSATLAGRETPGSGFRGGATEPQRNATTRLRPATPGHPVLAGLEAGFAIEDKLYLKTAEFESQVVPLLRSDFSFRAENFSPPPLAPRAEREAWSHPPGSDLVAWASACGNSPVVALELGDGSSAYGSPAFRKLLCNSLRWVASAEAGDWAASFPAYDALGES
jgi:hypothetical protein